MLSTHVKVVMRICNQPGCTKHSKFNHDKCRFHLKTRNQTEKGLDRTRAKYFAFVDKLTKLPAKNRKKGKAIDSLLKGEVALATPGPTFGTKTILRQRGLSGQGEAPRPPDGAEPGNSEGPAGPVTLHGWDPYRDR